MTPHKLTKEQIEKFRVDLFAGVGVLHGGVPRPEAGISAPHGHIPRPENARMQAHQDGVLANIDLSFRELAASIPPDEITPDATKNGALCANERRYYVELVQALYWTRVYAAMFGCGWVVHPPYEEGSYCWNAAYVIGYFEDEKLVSAARIKQWCGTDDGGVS
jgi:hypothetical protein